MNHAVRQSMQRRYHALHRELCAEFDLPASGEQRHQVAEWILGYRKSSRDWTGKEYSIVIDQLREWIAGGVRPGPLDQNTRNQRDFDQRKKQLVHAIETAGYPEAKIAKIAEDTFGRRPWRELGTLQLTRLRFTVTARARAKSKPR